jgi:hypothetical protein
MNSLLFYNSDCQAVICTLCKYALRQGTDAIANHLSMRHEELFANNKELRAYAKRFAAYEQRPPKAIQITYIPSNTCTVIPYSG